MLSIAKTSGKILAAVASTTILSLGFSASSYAAAIIDNGTIQLGVDDLGQLNIPGGSPSTGTGTTNVGLRYLPTGSDGTSPGCLCEGWGVADATTGLTGYANNSVGTSGLTFNSFTSTGTTATSTVSVGSSLRVTHSFKPSTVTANLYEALVTIENIGTTSIGDLRYRRVMDWDVEPTAFNEFVTIQGGAAATNLLFSSNNGFASSNPLAGNSDLGATGDFIDFGPKDHGALFDFGFGPLNTASSLSFSIFYGATATEKDALKALGDVGAEVYSLGQTATGSITGDPNTFIFAFKGVGGVAVPPTGDKVPEPATILGTLAFAAFGSKSWMNKRKKVISAT